MRALGARARADATAERGRRTATKTKGVFFTLLPPRRRARAIRVVFRDAAGCGNTSTRRVREYEYGRSFSRSFARGGAFLQSRFAPRVVRNRGGRGGASRRGGGGGGGLGGRARGDGRAPLETRDARRRRDAVTGEGGTRREGIRRGGEEERRATRRERRAREATGGRRKHPTHRAVRMTFLYDMIYHVSVRPRTSRDATREKGPSVKPKGVFFRGRDSNGRSRARPLSTRSRGRVISGRRSPTRRRRGRCLWCAECSATSPRR